MAHYDGQCRHCKDYGYFLDVSCSCGAAVAERKAKEDAQIAKEQADRDFLKQYGIDAHNLGSGNKVWASHLVVALKKLIEEGRLS